MAQQEEVHKYGYVVVGILMLATASMGGVWSSTAVFMVLIVNELLFPYGTLGYVMGGGLIAVMMLPLVGFTQVFRGPLKERGPKFGLMVGIALIGVFGTVQAFCPEYWSMLICRFLAATGFGIIFLFQSVVIMSFFGASRARATAGTMALMAGLVVGAFSATYYSIPLYYLLGASWRFASAFWGILGLVATLLWLVLGKGSPYD